MITSMGNARYVFGREEGCVAVRMERKAKLLHRMLVALRVPYGCLTGASMPNYLRFALELDRYI